MMLNIATADSSSWMPVKLFSDPGADMVMIVNEDAVALGYNLDLLSDTLHIQGIDGQSIPFKIAKVWTQIGNMKPMQIPIAMCSVPGGLAENLLGNQGILDSGISETFDAKGVTYKSATADAAANLSFY
jgi:hypothetical protein